MLFLFSCEMGYWMPLPNKSISDHVKTNTVMLLLSFMPYVFIEQDPFCINPSDTTVQYCTLCYRTFISNK